ncbi:MAG: hypothetical protein ACJ8IQ_03615 [Chthoniobacterales bacterium]
MKTRDEVIKSSNDEMKAPAALIKARIDQIQARRVLTISELI